MLTRITAGFQSWVVSSNPAQNILQFVNRLLEILKVNSICNLEHRYKTCNSMMPIFVL